MNHSVWTIEGLDERFRKLVSRSGSYAEIAKILNAEFGTKFTRNSCIGRANRTNVKAPPSEPGEPRKIRRRRKRGGDGALVQKIEATKARAAKPKPIFAPIVDADIPPWQQRTIFELTEDTCRWPLGEGRAEFYCGAPPLRGQSYCGPHCARAYRPTSWRAA